ncbi:hypothetical protein KIH24_14275 [Rhizobiales bacterium TNE-4]|nr:hypothetical protein [Rhizobiales bacterium TNE-4]MBV1828786.1 hypothetical protein [Rhizobiales bacterium TNE-4]
MAWIFCCRLATMALSGGNGLIILAFGLTGAFPAAGAFGGVGAEGFLGKLYCVVGLALGSISIRRIIYLLIFFDLYTFGRNCAAEGLSVGISALTCIIKAQKSRTHNSTLVIVGVTLATRE